MVFSANNKAGKCQEKPAAPLLHNHIHGNWKQRMDSIPKAGILQEQRAGMCSSWVPFNFTIFIAVNQMHPPEQQMRTHHEGFNH